MHTLLIYLPFIQTPGRIVNKPPLCIFGSWIENIVTTHLEISLFYFTPHLLLFTDGQLEYFACFLIVHEVHSQFLQANMPRITLFTGIAHPCSPQAPLLQLQIAQPPQTSNLYFSVSQFHTMGNTNPTNTNHLDFDLACDYKELKKDPNGTILMHNQTQITYLLKEYTYGSDMQFEQERHRLEKEIEAGILDTVLSVVKIKSHTIHGLCSTTHKLYAIYEYPQVTLHDQIQARQKEEKRFDEHELWSVLQSCNMALSQLKSTISLNAEKVFITPEGQLKVIHNDMIDQTYRFSIDNKHYYAPEKLRNFGRLDNDSGLIKEAVFSMGMTLLQAAILDEVIDCYDYNQHLFLEVSLENMIESLNGIYSEDFIEILTNMVDINPNRRSTFVEIQRMLDNYWNNSGEDGKNAEIQENGESLNIQLGDEKRLFMTSQDDRGIFKNLATVNSNQKDSIRVENNLNSLRKPSLVSEKIPEFQKEKPSEKKKPAQTELYRSKEPTLRQPQNKENLYTDPKLLAMIKKDLEDINKLKQSTLKQTIKYSFLYPETQSIFSSIKDIKLSMNHQQNTSLKSETKPLHEKSMQNINQSIKSNDKSLRQSLSSDIKPQDKINQLQFNKESFIDRQNEMQMRKMQKSKQCLTFAHFKDEEGKEYEGFMMNGMKEGRGKLMFSDGAFYQGEFKEDKMNGKGILYYNEGKPAYDGIWVNDHFHGEGTLYNESPIELSQPFNYEDFEQVDEYWFKYEGQFYYDNKCGLGRLYLTNGEIIEAMFENDCINGEGRFINIYGQEIDGKWDMNKMIRINAQ